MRGRVVRFPSEPIGTYWLFSGIEQRRPIVRDACDEVEVPPGWGLALILEDAQAFRRLGNLDPNSVDRLCYAARSGNAHPPGDASLRFVQHLSGLRHLHLRGLNLSGRDFSWLRPLCMLEELHLQNDSDFAGPLSGILVENLSKDAPLSRLELHHVRLGEPHLHRVSRFEQLTHLEFEYERSDGSGFAKLRRLSALEELAVTAGARDDDFAVLGALSRLRILKISSQSVTSGIGVHLRKCQNLEELRLMHAPLTDSILRDIGELRSLSDLDLSYTRIHGELESIEHLPVRSLRLAGLRVTDTDVRPIGKLPALERLDLGSTHITDIVGPVLGRLSRLQELDLSHTGVIDRTLDFLAKLPNLRRLDVTGTWVSEQAAQRLCEMIPRLMVQKYGEWEVRGELAAGRFYGRTQWTVR